MINELAPAPFKIVNYQETIIGQVVFWSVETQLHIRVLTGWKINGM